MSTVNNQTADPVVHDAKPDVGVISPPQPGLSDSSAAAPLHRAVLDEHHLRFAEAQNSYISTYIQLADTKASWTFAASSALIAFLVSSSDTRAILSSHVVSLAFWVVMAALGLLIVSAVFAFRVIAPRLRSSSAVGLFFFGTAAGFSDSQSYVKAVGDSSFDQLVRERIQHNYDIARVCIKKYQNLRPAFWCGALGVVLLALFLVMQTSKPARQTVIKDSQAQATHELDTPRSGQRAGHATVPASQSAVPEAADSQKAKASKK